MGCETTGLGSMELGRRCGIRRRNAPIPFGIDDSDISRQSCRPSRQLGALRMNISQKDLDRVFLLADEVSEIEHWLADGFQELSFLFYADDVLAWLTKNHQ